MIFRITFQRTGKYRMLPVDYQYYLSAWIYKVIANTDPGFSAFLHSEGYKDGNKRFKLFAYFPLNLGKPLLWKEKSLFELRADRIFMQVAFHLSDAAEKFIIGLFNNQQLYIGDRFNGIDLCVVQVERIPDPPVNNVMYYKALSPVVVSVMTGGEKYARYLSPDDDGYAEFIKNNLLQRRKAIPGTLPVDVVDAFSLKLKTAPRSKLITVKPGTKQQSKIRGYIFDFELKAPEEFHRLILSSSIGEKGSTGFGWCEVITNPTPNPQGFQNLEGLGLNSIKN
ncbi:MAG: CRISPR-associated endoribonuclease Cas6 [Prolixibacteraceae bacterium]|jgi:CRISPR-associated endoribonuclease Cas6|nr:CRISPR-associated endoribonuclease Cas6 [Prolixibacteraceae bacterium]